MIDAPPAALRAPVSIQAADVAVRRPSPRGCPAAANAGGQPPRTWESRRSDRGSETCLTAVPPGPPLRVRAGRRSTNSPHCTGELGRRRSGRPTGGVLSRRPSSTSRPATATDDARSNGWTHKTKRPVGPARPSPGLAVTLVTSVRATTSRADSRPPTHRRPGVRPPICRRGWRVKVHAAHVGADYADRRQPTAVVLEPWGEEAVGEIPPFPGVRTCTSRPRAH